MPRALSLTLREAMNAAQTGEFLIMLVTFSHAALDEPMRFSTDPTERLSTDPLVYGTISRGNTYQFVPFTFLLPDEKDEAPPEAKIVLDNIDRSTIALLRSTNTPAVVSMEFVARSALDTVEIAMPDFDLSAVDYDATSLSMTLSKEAYATEPFPAGAFTPASFPGLF